MKTSSTDEDLFRKKKANIDILLNLDFCRYSSLFELIKKITCHYFFNSKGLSSPNFKTTVSYQIIIIKI